MNEYDTKKSKTKNKLYAGLCTLLHSNELKDIDVKKLCESSGINRTTFYLHYQNIFDLKKDLMEFENEKIMRIIESMDKKLTEHYSKYDKKYQVLVYQVLLNSILENKEYYEIVLKILTNDDFKLLMSFIRDNFVFPIIKNKSEYSLREAEYIASFCSVGIISILFKWINCNYKDTPKKITDLIIHCLYK